MLTKIKPVWWLCIGLITIALAHMSIHCAEVGWIAYTPFLVYLRLNEGIKSRMIFILFLVVAWSLCIVKIVSPPMPLAMVFLFSIPISLFHLPAFLIWDRFKQHPWSALLFPTVLTLMEWIQYTFTPFASWGVAAYSQAGNITTIQSVSLFGIAGLSFILYWSQISIAELITGKKYTLLTFQLPVFIIAFLFLFGSIRFDLSKSRGVDTATVAAVGTDSEVSGFPLPSKEANELIKKKLFERTAQAANSDAALIVWNEASTFILPADEKEWTDSLAALSGRLGVYLVASYVVPLSESPMKYENKYMFFNSEGQLLKTYNKHQPVPGEPAEKGKEALQVFNMGNSKVGAVICYDYDFPYLAKAYGTLNADIIADPSSDWRGIDPLHSQMAAFRAVEQGHSILRSTRFGLSAAITPFAFFLRFPPAEFLF